MTNESFHFLRPEWLWVLAGIPLLIVAGRRRERAAGAWRRVCDPELLPHLLHTRPAPGGRWALPALVAGWLATALALAGPTWERLPETAYSEPTQTVAVLQLTPSMHNRDTAPSRLDRARYELQDLLAQVEGTVGLVIFAEEAYGVTPLTHDARVIAEVVPTLDPRLMPGRGARLDRGIEEAHRLLDNAGARAGRIVLFVDGPGAAPGLAMDAAEAAANAGYPVSVLGLHPDPDALEALAAAGSGRFSPVRADESDVALLLGHGAAGPEDFAALRESGFEADTWQDAGAMLLWLPLLLAPLAFRRGWAGSLGAGLILLATPPAPAQAGVENWFSRPDQQGAAAFEAGQHTEAADRFEDPEWRGVAAYRGGDLDQAIDSLAALPSARARYNLGNALARSGQLEAALAAYDRVLEAEADHEDARHNREIVAKALEEQTPPQSESQPESQPQGGESSSGDSQGGEEQSSAQPSEEASGGEEQSGAQPSEEASAGGEQAGEEASQPSGTSQVPPGGAQADSAQGAPEAGEGEERNGNTQGHEEPSRAPDAPPSDPQAEGLARGEGSPPGGDGDPSSDPARVAAEGRTPMSEQEQEIEQWLARVPDDPGGLLREKLRRRYAEKRGLSRARRGGSTW